MESIFQQISPEKTKIWKERAAILDYAFQPIVNSFTGDVYGYEALLRNTGICGFDSIFSLMDEAFRDRALYALDLMLRRKAITKFKTIPEMYAKTLFYNLDNRVLEMPDYHSGKTDELLQELNIQKSSLFLEISERHEFHSYISTSAILDKYKKQSFRIAIDDYGSGYSGLQLLYHSNPDMIKIDRFFIEGIQDDPIKKLFIENIVNMAHLMGIKVIAEGIETQRELNFCRLIGCDYFQGFFISKPEIDISLLKSSYSLDKDKTYGRREEDDRISLMDNELDKISPVTLSTDFAEILERFKIEDLRILPVVDHQNRPIGCIREKDLKKYVYSTYGISLLKNKSHSKGLEAFLTRVPVSEESKNLESLMKIAAAFPDFQGILITRNGEYRGILNPSQMIELINETEIAKARDQNPLTHLPGNFAINRKLTEILKRPQESKYAVYFDFNNFKPYNDAYGFRQGDRVIILFAELLKRELSLSDDFIGHIGGDDFIVIFRESDNRDFIQEKIGKLQNDFSHDVSSYYRDEDREKGHILGKDRNGRILRFPLLTVSAAFVEIQSEINISLEVFTERIMKLKKKAKSAPPPYFAWEILGKTNLEDFNLSV